MVINVKQLLPYSLCPICGQKGQLQPLKPNGEYLSVTEKINDEVRIFDKNVSWYRCINNHTFYISFEE